MSPGLFILPAGIVLTALGLLLRWRQWNKRWGEAAVDITSRIRFEGFDDLSGSGSFIRDLDRLHEAVRILRAHVPVDYWVEVVKPGHVSTPTVPSGKLKDGRTAGASMRTERLFPWTRKWWVAVVTLGWEEEENRWADTGGYLIHEVTRHIYSMENQWGLDAEHKNERLGLIEKTCKTELGALIPPEGK